jgi:alkylated DNA nucleotide flippase Atl1
MAATIEKAKAQDPRALRQEIAKLNYRILEIQRDFKNRPVPEDKQKIKEVPVLKGKQLAQLESLCTKLMREAERHGSAMSIFWSNLNQVAESLLKAIKLAGQAPTAIPARHDVSRRVPTRMHTSPSVRTQTHEQADKGGLAMVERKFLTALAQQGRPLTRNQIAIFAGYSAKSRHVDNTLAVLRSNQYVAGGRDGIEITGVGLTALGHYDPLPIGAGLRRYWLNELDRAASAFLQVLCEVHPRTLTRDELAEQAGYSPQSRHVDNTLAHLRSRELVSGGRNGLKASEVLFD